MTVNQDYNLSFYEDECSYRAHVIFRNIKSRCKKEGIPVTITEGWLEDKLRAGVCEITYMALQVDGRVKGGKTGVKTPWAPSVERVDPSKGYTKENCKLVCWMYNIAKNKFTHEDVVKFANSLLLAESSRQSPEDKQAISDMLQELREEEGLAND